VNLALRRPRHNAAMSWPEPATGSPSPEPGPPQAELFTAMERELHGIAQGLLRGERANHTLQPTALLHEAWLRLARVHRPWEDHAHFVRAAAGTMRRVLVEHGRARLRDKRGGSAARVTLSTDLHGAGAPPDDLLAVDDALRRLAELDPELAEVVELRVFGGLGHREIAAVTGRSQRTVERAWRLARAFLRRDLGGP
jgi:RNA polymerase sigma factor (TIGR02999 family)